MGFCPKDHARLSRGLTGSADVPRRCTSCDGLWIPGAVVASAIGHVPRTVSSPGVAALGLMRCPDDGKALTAIHYHGVEIDLCAGCGGVWLDHGELVRIEENRRRTTVADVAVEVASNLDVVPGPVDTAGDLVGAALEFLGEALSGL